MATAKERIEVQARLKDDFTRPVRGMSKTLSTFTKGAVGGFGRLIRAATSFRGLLLALGSAYVVRSFTRMVTETAKTADAFAKMGEQLGLSVELLSKLEFAGRRAGVEFNTITMAMQRLTRRMAEYQLTGAGPAAAGFEILGEEIKAAAKAGEGMETLLPKLAKAFEAIEDPQTKILAAFKLFDSEGVRVLRLLDKEFEGLLKHAEEMGMVMGTEAAREAERFNDNLEDLKDSFEGLKRTVVLELLPSLADGLQDLTRWIQENKHDIIGFFRDDLVEALEEVEIAVNRMSRGFLMLHRHYLELSRAGSLIIGPVGQKILGVDPDEWNRIYSESLRSTGQLELRLAEIMTNRSIRQKQRAARDWAADQPFTGPRSFQDAVARSQALGVPGEPPGAFIGPPQWVPRQADPLMAGAAADFYKMQAHARRMDVRGGLRQGLDALTEMYAPAHQAAQAVVTLTDSLAVGLSDALIESIKNADNAADAFEALGKAMLDIASRALMEGAIKGLIGAGFSALGFGVGGGGGGGAQHGAIIPPSVNRPMMLHGGAHGEAAIPLQSGGRIPVEFLDGGGGGTQILVVNAMDSRDVNRFFVEGLRSNPQLVSGVVAKVFQNSRSYRGQMYG